MLCRTRGRATPNQRRQRSPLTLRRWRLETLSKRTKKMTEILYKFCLHHQGAILLLVLASIITSGWCIFYGRTGEKGKNVLLTSIALMTAITIYGAWHVYHEYHQLPGYLTYVGLPYLIMIMTSTLRIKLNISNAVTRPLLAAGYLLSAFWYSFCILSWLTPVFALVHY